MSFTLLFRGLFETLLANNLSVSLLHDLNSTIISTEIVALAFFGRYLTGPWMTNLYGGVQISVQQSRDCSIAKEILHAILYLTLPAHSSQPHWMPLKIIYQKVILFFSL